VAERALVNRSGKFSTRVFHLSGPRRND